jgi:SRSO17 transposase
MDEIRKPALMRWSIEQCFKEMNTYLGMDHYETINWTAFHRYMLLSNLSHLFIINFGKVLPKNERRSNALY